MANGVFFGLTAALFWGVADLFMRGAAKREGVFLTLFFTEIIATIGFLVSALPLGLLSFSHATPQIILLAAALNLMILVGAGFLYRAFAIGTLSLVSPLVASFAAVTAGLALLAGEDLTLPIGVGLALTLVGVVVASMVSPSPSTASTDIKALAAASDARSKKQGAHQQAHTSPHSPSQHGKRARGIGLLGPGVAEALISVLIFGVAYFALRYVTPTLGGVQTAFVGKVADMLALFVLAAVVAVWAWRRPANKAPNAEGKPASSILSVYRVRWPQRGFWLFVVLGALLDTAANVAYNIGLTTALTSIVVTLSSLFSAVTVLLAWVFLHERLALRQWLGVIAILIGVALINWS